ncbi:MAG: protein translocase subunit SecD [Geminicoccaceae bacterium]|nr:protein translocase subunit SecD [Geminicoccaceae bacterium]MCB9943117.1 protein translocase subunit SecD [Geminicoccaceae bacterium]
MLNYPRWKVIVVSVVLLFGIAFSLPNLVSRETAESLPDWLPRSQINLGLDLQGGSHLLLQVEIGDVIKERLDTLRNDVRLALRKAQIGHRQTVRNEHLVVSLTDPAQLQDALAEIETLNPVVPTGAFGNPAGRTYEIENDSSGRITIGFSESARAQLVTSTVSQSLEVVRRRIDELGTREPTIQRQGDDRVLVQVPGERNPEKLKALLGTTARMTFHMVNMEGSVQDALAGRVPPGSRLLEADPSNPGPEYYLVENKVELSGDNLVDAQATVDSNHMPAVSFRFDNTGARKFGEITQEYTGRLFAIVLDDKVISAPRIREPILGGSGIITGSFSFDEANNLAVLLRAGALPAPLTIIEERTVGPDLGADSIAAGKLASILGLVLVAVFMAAYYGLFGIFANVALIANLVLIVAALSVLGATLTLPGIAGIVLTIGMAVDANVLIFERIRDEVGRGRTPLAAIGTGFSEAMRTIVDANVTTLIAAVLLFQFGSGPVKGFAVTLTVGIVTSMFTAIMVTRLLMMMWFQRARPAALPI